MRSWEWCFYFSFVLFLLFFFLQVALCAVMGVCALSNAVLGVVFFHEKLVQMCFAMGVSVLLAVLAFLWYVYMHTHTHVHTHAHTHIHTSVLLAVLAFLWHVYMHAHTHVHTFTHTHIHTSGLLAVLAFL